MSIVYEEGRITIRALEVTDAIMFTKWWNNGALMKDVGFKKGMGVSVSEMEEAFAAEIKDTNPYRNKRRYVVEDRESHKPIGELTYGNLDMNRKSCGIGIKICDISLQGKGLGQETLIAFMRYLCEKFQLDIIEIDTLKDNERAYKLYKKLGFQEVKTMENFWTDPEGESHDLVFMELKKEKFYKELNIE